MQPRTSQSGNYVQALADEESFHLGLGQPSPSLLPLDIVRQSSARLFEKADPLLLQYNKSAGATSLRSSIAQLLSQHRGQEIAAESLIVSAGNSQALDWVASTLSSPGDTVVCESPTYFLAAKILQDAGLKLQGVPVDSQGLDVDALRASLEAGLRPRWLYCIPTHHNPTGVNLSQDRLEQLLLLAQRYDFLVVFDDPYAQLHFGEQSQSALDRSGALGEGPWIRLGSFSKIFAPGLRLGWIEASPAVQEQLLGKGMLRSGGGLNPISGAIVQQAIESGELQSHRDRVRQKLAERYAALQSAIALYSPELKLWPVSGGYFAWLEWESDFPAREFSRYAKSKGLIFLPGELCCPQKSGQWSHAARVSLAFYEAKELNQAMQHMAQLRESFSTQST